MLTICVTCTHHVHEIRNEADPMAWYNFRCKADGHRLIQIPDRVTGIPTPEDVRPYCRDVNNGECGEYIARPDTSSTSYKHHGGKMNRKAVESEPCECVTCTVCSGTGRIRVDHWSGYETETCEDCNNGIVETCGRCEYLADLDDLP